MEPAKVRTRVMTRVMPRVRVNIVSKDECNNYISGAVVFESGLGLGPG